MQSTQQHNRSISSRQPARCVLLLLVLFCSSGATCTRSLRNPFSTLGPPAPEVLAVGASLEQVIAAVNQNSARVHSYQTNNASITIPGQLSIPLLRGNLAAQRPGRVRLQASTALSGPEVDLGSNDQLFWFWVRRNEPPALYFSRHDQFVGNAAQQALPIEPQWLFDALGLVQFASTDYHEGPLPRGNGRLEIRSVVNTRNGQITKTTVVDASRAWVLEQHFYNSSGTLLASTVALSHRYYPELGVSLPQQLEIRLPADELSLSIEVGSVQLNQLADNPALWSLPVLSGYPQIDLGSAASASQPITSSPIPSPWQNQTIPASHLIPVSPAIQPTQVLLPSDIGQPLGYSANSQQLPPGGVPASSLLNR